MKSFRTIRNKVKFGLADMTVGIFSAMNHLFRKNKPYTDDIVFYLSDIALGDLLVITGGMVDFLRKCPERGISVICYPKNVEAVRLMGIFERIYTMDRKKDVSKIRAKDYVAMSPWAANHTAHCVARVVIADRKWYGKDEINKYVTDKEQARYQKNFTHVVDISFRTLSSASGSIKTAKMLSAVSGTDIKPDILRFDVKAQEPATYFIVNPGAAVSKKVWPVERFAPVIRHICEHTGLMPVVVGGKNEDRLCRELTEILSRTAPDIRVRNMCCQTDLRQLTELTGNAAFYFGNDTGTTHVAVSCGIPSVSITAEYFDDICLQYPEGLDAKTVVIKDVKTCPYEGRCFRENKIFSESCRECLNTYGTFECIRGIDVETVIERIDNSGLLTAYTVKADV